MSLFTRKPKPPVRYVLYRRETSTSWIEQGTVLEETTERFHVQYSEFETLMSSGRHVYSHHEVWIKKGDVLEDFERAPKGGTPFSGYRALTDALGETTEGYVVDAVGAYVKLRIKQLAATRSSGRPIYSTQYIWLSEDAIELV